MKTIYKSIFLSAISLLAVSCNDEFENDVDKEKVSAGDADFSRYVALGNSLTSGYADGALYKSGQENSYPAIIASQMKRAGGGEFNQPLMPDDVGGFSDLGFSGKLSLKLIDGKPVPVALESNTQFSSSFVKGKFNNMGVPGAKSYHLLAPGYGNASAISQGLANPYFARFATSPNTTVLTDALAQDPTFFTLWIGNNDVLSFATSGGDGINQAGNFDVSSYWQNDISAPEVVINVVKTISESMVNKGAKGALANIPNVTSIPFFTTIPSKPLTPANKVYADKINDLNEFYSLLNNVFASLGKEDRKIEFDQNGASGIVFVDDSIEDLTLDIATVLIQSGVDALKAQLLATTFGQVRQTKSGDLIPLTMSSKIGTVDKERAQYLMAFGVPEDKATLLSIIGLTYAKDEYVLSKDEVDQVLTATESINNGISQVANAYNLVYVDMNEEMKKLQKGLIFNGVNYNADYISGGSFSLDGVHLNSRGYVVISNIFIQKINEKYHSNLPQVNPNNYAGIQLP